MAYTLGGGEVPANGVGKRVLNFGPDRLLPRVFDIFEQAVRGRVVRHLDGD